ncbi:ArsR/SmtB family transcription factor [Actinomadura roseirufa]|uniref:ArsR/SmtB family transcription factor n=1 Tax=Actinomadura roseirufa TaxID=2094049 RepID=UPI001F5FB770|nr:winged helix-turn-helix domain-containing protein [Actinomadura roseirufa]
MTLTAFTCQSSLTGDRADSRDGTLTSEELLAALAAIGHPQRLRVIGALAEGRVHVSELARRLGISRPLLYLHLERLEKAGLVAGSLELSPDGKALKYFELVPFDLHLTTGTVLAALRADEEKESPQ